MKSIWILFFTLLFFSKLTAVMTWSAPTTLSSAGVDSSEPRVAIDPNGNAVAVWVENGFVTASTQLIGGMWTMPFTLSNAGASTPRLGVDNSGNAVVIWLEAGVVTASNYTFSMSSWSAAVSVSSATATMPALSVQTNGNAVAVWVRGTAIEASTQLFGMAWSASTPISATGADNPSIAIGANGTVVTVWHIVVSGNDTIQSASATVGGAWAAAINVLPVAPGFIHNYPKVAVDSNGNTIAVWFRYNFQSPDYLNVATISSSLPHGAVAWTPIPTALSQIFGLRNPATQFLRIGFDGTGNAAALWTSSFDGETFNVESATRSVNGLWSPSVYSVYQNRYALAADFSNTSIGDNLDVFMLWDGASVIIQSAESNENGYFTQSFWTNNVTISQGTNNAYPRCAASVIGTTKNAVAVWIGYDGMNNVIQTSTGLRTVFSPPTITPPVTQAVNDYHTFQDYYNTINWTASPGANYYAIYRDGVYVGLVDSNTLQFIDHNQIQNGPLTYGVAAIGSQAEHSGLATISYP